MGICFIEKEKSALMIEDEVGPVWDYAEIIGED